MTISYQNSKIYKGSSIGSSRMFPGDPMGSPDDFISKLNFFGEKKWKKH